MTRLMWTPVLALGAVLAGTGAAGAGDGSTVPLAGAAGTTMTLGGQGSAARAAGEDNELTHGRRYGGYGWGGYRVGYYGGYRGGYYGGYRPYYGNYVSFSYRPAYYYTPRVYYPTYYRSYPVYSTYYYNSCAPSFGFTFGIGGSSVSAAPAVNLGGPVTQPMAQPAVPDGTFRYDGGPAVPVPLPKADPQAIPPANPSSTATDLPISLKPKPAATPYRYKAYGEK